MVGVSLGFVAFCLGGKIEFVPVVEPRSGSVCSFFFFAKTLVQIAVLATVITVHFLKVHIILKS